MANSEVLLLQPIKGLGAEGDTVTVRAGYARNFLLPRKQALPITQANKKHVESLLKARETREQKEFESARTLGEQDRADQHCNRSEDWRRRQDVRRGDG